MKKENFATLLLGTLGLTLFALGICMCLVTPWDVFLQGIVMGTAGLVVLLATLIVRRKIQGKPAFRLNGKAVGIALIGIAGMLALGVGMCMTMVWEGLMVPGVVIGIFGIMLMIFPYPLWKGLQ